MNIKKVIVLLFAVFMGQMVASSDVDLYRGSLFWIKDQNNVEGIETRNTTYPLKEVFDESFNNQLAGTAIPTRNLSMMVVDPSRKYCRLTGAILSEFNGKDLSSVWYGMRMYGPVRYNF